MKKEDLPFLIGLGAILLMIKRERPVLEGHSVKEEFWKPCKSCYQSAVDNLKFVATFHNPEAILKEVKKDVLGY